MANELKSTIKNKCKQKVRLKINILYIRRCQKWHCCRHRKHTLFAVQCSWCTRSRQCVWKDVWPHVSPCLVCTTLTISLSLSLSLPLPLPLSALINQDIILSRLFWQHAVIVDFWATKKELCFCSLFSRKCFLWRMKRKQNKIGLSVSHTSQRRHCCVWFHCVGIVCTWLVYTNV